MVPPFFFVPNLWVNPYWALNCEVLTSAWSTCSPLALPAVWGIWPSRSLTLSCFPIGLDLNRPPASQHPMFRPADSKPWPRYRANPRSRYGAITPLPLITLNGGWRMITTGNMLMGKLLFENSLKNSKNSKFTLSPIYQFFHFVNVAENIPTSCKTSCLFIPFTPILWPPEAKNWVIGKDPDAGKDWRREEKGTTEDEMVGRHHRLKGPEFE